MTSKTFDKTGLPPKWIVSASAQGCRVDGDWPYAQKHMVMESLRKLVQEKGVELCEEDIQWRVQRREKPLCDLEADIQREFAVVNPAPPQAELSDNRQKRREDNAEAYEKKLAEIRADDRLLNAGDLAQSIAERGVPDLYEVNQRAPGVYLRVVKALLKGEFERADALIFFLDVDGQISSQKSANLITHLAPAFVDCPPEDKKRRERSCISITKQLWLDKKLAVAWAVREDLLDPLPGGGFQAASNAPEILDVTLSASTGVDKSTIDDRPRPRTPKQRRIIADIEKVFGSLTEAENYTIPEIKHKLGRSYADTTLKRILGRAK